MSTSTGMECFLCNEVLLAAPSDSLDPLSLREEHSQVLTRLFGFLHQYCHPESSSVPAGRKVISSPDLLQSLRSQLETVDFCKKCVPKLGQLVQSFKRYDQAGNKLERLREEFMAKLRIARGGTWEDNSNYELRTKIIDGFTDELPSSAVKASPVRQAPMAHQLCVQVQASTDIRTPVIKLCRLENILALAKLISRARPITPIKNEFSIKEEPMDLEACPDVNNLDLTFGSHTGHGPDSPESHASAGPDLPSDSDFEYEPDPPSDKKSRRNPPKDKKGHKSKMKTPKSKPNGLKGRSSTRPGRLWSTLTMSQRMAKLGQYRKNKFMSHLCDFDDCNQKFDGRQALEEHILEFHAGSQRPWRCDHTECGAQFYKQSSLTHHTHFAHSTTYKYPCPKCLKGFAHYNEFVGHQLRFHGEAIGYTGKLLTINNKYKCADRAPKPKMPSQNLDSKRRPLGVYKPVFPCDYEGCEFRGRNEWETQDHFQDVHPSTTRPYSCPECEARFISEERLARHKHWTHSTLLYPCQDCDYACNKVDAMERHRLRAHRQGERCHHEGCDYVGTKLGLKRHLESSVHADPDSVQRNHVCQHCGEAFLNPFRLKYHINARHPDLVADPEEFKRYRCECEQCGKTLCDPATLRMHIKLVHTREVNQDIQCDKCGKNFLTMSRLRAHSRSHLTPEEFEHECQVCHAKFRARSELNTHMRRHTGDFKDVCKECGKKFIDGGSLRRHEKIHAGVLQHVCPHCNKAFPLRGYLTTHLKSHMSKEERAELKKRKSETPAPALQKLYHDLWRKKSTVASVAAVAVTDPQAEIETPEYPMHFNYQRQRRQISRVLSPEEMAMAGGPDGPS